MTLRPPRPSSTPQRQDALDYEVAREQASTLGRLGRALERALAALSEFDRAHSADEGGANEEAQTRALRARLVHEASNALWCFIIQREACGLRDPRPVLRAYNVPVDVQNRMGTFSPAISRPIAAN